MRHVLRIEDGHQGPAGKGERHIERLGLGARPDVRRHQHLEMRRQGHGGQGAAQVEVIGLDHDLDVELLHRIIQCQHGVPQAREHCDFPIERQDERIDRQKPVIIGLPAPGHFHLRRHKAGGRLQAERGEEKGRQQARKDDGCQGGREQRQTTAQEGQRQQPAGQDLNRPHRLRRQMRGRIPEGESRLRAQPLAAFRPHLGAKAFRRHQMQPLPQMRVFSDGAAHQPQGPASGAEEDPRIVPRALHQREVHGKGGRPRRLRQPEGGAGRGSKIQMRPLPGGDRVSVNEPVRHQHFVRANAHRPGAINGPAQGRGVQQRRERRQLKGKRRFLRARSPCRGT